MEERWPMALTSVLSEPTNAVAHVGATDILVYRRSQGTRFVLTAPAQAAAAEEFCVEQEPAVEGALRSGLRRVASEQPRLLCAGYVARTAAVVALDRDVVVILGRRDGCLAGVSDVELMAAAEAAAALPLAS
jgi:hypothetical protein